MNYNIRNEFERVDFWNNRLERKQVRIPKLLESIERRPANLNSFSDGLDAALIAEGLGYGPNVVWPYLNVGVDFGAAHFASCYEIDGVETTITYQGTNYPYTVRKGEPSSAEFFQILSAAVIARNKAAAKALYRVPIDRFPIKSSRKFDAQLIAILSNQEPSIEKLDATIKDAENSEEYDEGIRSYDQLILAPLFRTYRAVLKEDITEYKEFFTEALKSHIEYYRSESPNHLRALISFKLMAAAVLGFDRFGWTVPVESRVVSRWMVEGKGLDR